MEITDIIKTDGFIVFVCVHALFLIIICSWGLDKIKSNCESSSSYTYLKSLLIISAVTFTLFISNAICNVFCSKNYKTSPIMAFLTFVYGILTSVYTGLIYGNIGECIDGDATTIKSTFLYGGIFSSCAIAVWGLKEMFQNFSKGSLRVAGLSVQQKSLKLEAAKLEKERQIEEAERGHRKEITRLETQIKKIKEQKPQKANPVIPESDDSFGKDENPVIPQSDDSFGKKQRKKHNKQSNNVATSPLPEHAQSTELSELGYSNIISE